MPIYLTFNMHVILYLLFFICVFVFVVFFVLFTMLVVGEELFINIVNYSCAAGAPRPPLDVDILC